MLKQEEANLILKLYELRREEVLRQARDWYVRNFFPESVADVQDAMMSEHGAWLRMVTTYWDMAAALVNHGAINIELFNDTNGEHFAVFCKVEHFLGELRTAYGPSLLRNLETLIDATPGGRDRVAAVRERLKGMRAAMDVKLSQAAG